MQQAAASGMTQDMASAAQQVAGAHVHNKKQGINQLGCAVEGRSIQ